MLEALSKGTPATGSQRTSARDAAGHAAAPPSREPRVCRQRHRARRSPRGRGESGPPRDAPPAPGAIRSGPPTTPGTWNKAYVQFERRWCSSPWRSVQPEFPHDARRRRCPCSPVQVHHEGHYEAQPEYVVTGTGGSGGWGLGTRLGAGGWGLGVGLASLRVGGRGRGRAARLAPARLWVDHCGSRLFLAKRSQIPFSTPTGRPCGMEGRCRTKPILRSLTVAAPMR